MRAVHATQPFAMAWRRAWRPSREDHVHDDLELVRIHQPGMRLLHGGRVHRLPARRWVLHWAAIPHHADGGDVPRDLTWVMVPLPEALRWGLGGALTALLGGAVLVDDGEDPAADALIARWDREQAAPMAPLPLPGRLEVEAIVRRLAARAGRPAPLRGREVRPVERLAAIIARRAHEPLTAAAIAGEAGLHPKYASALFRRATGMTMWAYLTRLRIAEAQRLLVTSDLTVVAAGLRAGFGSAARFHAAFARAVGSPPDAWRRRHDAAARPL